MGKEKAYTEVTFAEESALVIPATLELDSDKNGGSTTFYIGQWVYCRYFPGTYDETYTYSVNRGEVIKEGSKIPIDIVDEVVVFANSREATLDYVPDGGVEWEWDGYGGSNPTFVNNRVYLPTAIEVGVLKVSYTTLYDSIKVRSYEEASVLLVTTRGDDETDRLTITFEAGEEGQVGDTRNVVLTVKDFCNDTVIEGAVVQVQGPGISFIGTTDSSGQVTVGYCTIGQTYTLTMTASEYKDSADDLLNNDSFTVPELE